MNGGEALKGKGQLTVATSVTREGDRVDIRFKDTGPGISESYLSRLFDPFFFQQGGRPGYVVGAVHHLRHQPEPPGPISGEQTGPKGTTFVPELPAYKEPQKISTCEAT